MAGQKVNITIPVGRMVEGSLYKANDKNFDGKPLTVTSGPNAGQARVDYFFAVAIPKGPEKGWWETVWGQKIYQVAAAAFPQACQRPDFAWKIIDGDSTVPNKRNTKPCDKEGYPGHWVLRFAGGFAPKVYRPDSSGTPVLVTDVDLVKPGYFIEVNFNVDGNGNQNNPGVYLNHSMVCFRAYGPEIFFGPDVKEAGFGAAPLPAGASLTPPASSVPMPAAGTMQPSVPAAIPAPTAPIPVTPNPQFLQVPQTGAPAAALPSPIAAVSSPAPVVPVSPSVPVPPASPSNGRTMTAKAGGQSYEAFKSVGWDDANLIAQGYMQP
jgi:hypothetical protein